MSQTITIDIIAVVFDFDDTLMPDTTSKLLRAHAIQPEQFWPSARALLKDGYDQPSAYLRLLLGSVGQGKPLGKLTNKHLAEFGASLDGDFYPGLPSFFDDLKAEVAKLPNIEIEFYIISGGLQAMLQGNPTVQKYFAGVHGCQLGEDDEGTLTHIKRSVTFTEKTRYLFEINKGISQSESEVNPFLVNRDIPQSERRIPFKNILYVGDGLTDIPCFSTVKHFGGEAFGVFDPANPEKAKQAIQEFMVPRRVIGMYPPAYGQNDALGALLRAWVVTRAAQIQIERDIAKRAAQSVNR
jgi:phosphoserine phosphatase